MDALFSSLVGGHRLRECVVETLRNAAAASTSAHVDVHIMAFSFTDERIAALLAEIATRHPDLTIRVIADWNQGAGGDGRQLAALVRLALPNLLVRYKNDQPYTWDVDRQRLRWSYRASRGLLHHKTLGVFRDGVPEVLVCGSFNWTDTAAASYENLLVLTADEPGSKAVMNALEWEFEAMWSSGRVTLTPDEARLHHAKILEELRSDPTRSPGAVIGLGAGADTPLAVLRADAGSTGEAGDDCESSRADASVTVAFSSRSPTDDRGGRGYSPHNSSRHFAMRKPGGTTARVPLTLATVALDVIGRAQAGDNLHVAMYGLSPRVPEYGALLEAARRGVRLRVLLDGRVGRSVLRQLAIAARREQLPIELRAGNRMMHQKYIVHEQTHTVLTGTANLSTDASARHSEHIIVVRRRPELAAAFLADFAAIWSRLHAPSAAPASGAASATAERRES